MDDFEKLIDEETKSGNDRILFFDKKIKGYISFLNGKAVFPSRQSRMVGKGFYKVKHVIDRGRYAFVDVVKIDPEPINITDLLKATPICQVYSVCKCKFIPEPHFYFSYPVSWNSEEAIAIKYKGKLYFMNNVETYKLTHDYNTSSIEYLPYSSIVSSLTTVCEDDNRTFLDMVMKGKRDDFVFLVNYSSDYQGTPLSSEVEYEILSSNYHVVKRNDIIYVITMDKNFNEIKRERIHLVGEKVVYDYGDGNRTEIRIKD